MLDGWGELIAGRYLLGEELARGGSSVVHRGYDTQAECEVAIKVLHEGFAGREDFSVRMVREFRAMRMLSDTAAVTAHALSVTQSGALCLVMELLNGLDLDDYLADIERGGYRMQAAEVLSLLGPVVDTLERGHELGIVHRDLKPGNIFVLLERERSDRASGEFCAANALPEGIQDRVRLLDFGFCRASDTRSITPDGTVLGSPSYIPPEVWRGRASETDPTSDIYSFGAIVFRLLGGSVPFDAPTLKAKLESVCSGPRPSLCALRPDLPPEVDEWVQQVLAISPSGRFRRVRAMWNALRDALGGMHAAPSVGAAALADAPALAGAGADVGSALRAPEKDAQQRG